MSTARSIGIVVFDGVLTSEVIGPAEVFALASQREWFAGSKVMLIGVNWQPTVRTAEGITLGVDRAIDDDLSLDVLIVPGADDVDHLLTHAKLNAFIQKHQDSAQWIGSVCAGAFVLGSAGVLDGHKATTWHGGEASLQTQFPQVQVVHDTPVVVDQRRMTANGGLVSYRAALMILAKLTSADCARQVYDSLSIARIGTWADIEASLA